MDEPTRPGTPRSLPAAELQRRLEAGEPLQIVDVREDAELALARLPHAVLHLPLSRHGEWMPQLANRLGRSQPVVVLCHGGIRSWDFGCWLIQEQGYDDVWNLQGGIDAWSREVDPGVPRY
ncbi:rhodanese-like domain-containing protein [Synechococcus sp. CCY 9618]|uniref:rhodanese-like domain-containing protein n=1 Tax=Synechococcus sp. CCY 9618 TaxID=2815602 RepID=UPI001C214A18|nr:rhodanese-like domain-containing protein [Synechococcus sp. CCY 9618]